MSASIVCLLVTDFVYGLMLLQGTYDHQLWLDVGWIGFYLLGAPRRCTRRCRRSTAGRVVERGAHAPPPRPAGRRVADRAHDRHPRRPEGRRLRLRRRARRLHRAVRLVVSRMAGLMRQQERSLERERMLSSAGADLVAATGREEIDEVAVTAARSMAGADLVTPPRTGPAGGPRCTPPWPRRGRRGRGTGPRVAPRAGRPGRARARARRADRGGAPPPGRGALRLARPARQRPDHRDRARRDDHLPEPLDRAPARLRRRADGRAALRRASIPRTATASATCSPTWPRSRATSRRSSSARWSIDGTPHQFEVNCTNLLDDEHVGGIVLNCRDISERKAFEEQLTHQGPRPGDRPGEPRAVRRARPPCDRPARGASTRAWP